MQVIEIYEAEDGKRFDSEIDCVEYEAKLRARKFADTAFLYDEEGDLLPLDDEASIEKAYFIVADTLEAANFMHDEFNNYSTPWDDYDIAAGCWAYVGGEWIKADTIREIMRIIKRIS